MSVPNLDDGVSQRMEMENGNLEFGGFSIFFFYGLPREILWSEVVAIPF